VPWPFANWPAGTKSSEEAIQALKHQHERRHNPAPVAVRKMPPDESEKFYHYSDPFARSIPDYFSLEGDVSVLGARDADSSGLSLDLQAPHYGAPLPQILKRDFSCPGNYYACDSINAPTYCCRVDAQCIIIQDTGMGTIGCCPNGHKCEGSLKGCNSDQVACDASQGGGCCVKGFKCSSNGCVPDNSSGGTATTTVEGLPPPVPTGTCPTGFYSCAARFNGGCCRIGRDCAMTDCPARTTGPTTAGDERKTTPTAVHVPAGNCQTGWHSCPPSFNGGCCPTGYDCGITNCPANTLRGTLPPEIKRMPVSTGSAEIRAVAPGVVRKVIVIVWVVVGVNAL